jgi:hypothetical protein
MSESQTASTEVRIESPGFVRQTEGLLCHNLRTPWRARYARSFIEAARTAKSTIPNSVEVNQVPDANRIQSNCSK